MSPLKNVSSQNPRQIALEILRGTPAPSRIPVDAPSAGTGRGACQTARRGACAPKPEFTESLLESAFAETRLSFTDRALCQELVYGAIRWRATLDWLVSRKTDQRKQKPVLQILLRLGLYQIFWLDRIPGHAAVHETVELVKRNGLGAQAGFVNAVLRGYLREFEATKKLLAELKVSQPALGWSHPAWLVARWQKRWDTEQTAQLLEWNNTPPKTYARLNTLRFGRARSPLPAARSRSSNGAHGATRPALENAGDLLAQWREEGVEYDFVRRDWLEENLVFELKSHPPLAKLPSFQQGGFYIQDPGTLLAVTELNPQPGETILDFCAAPGGKTTFIAQRMNHQGRIVAQDVLKDRLKLVEENCARLGVTCVEVALPSGLDSRPSAAFDRILLDAPCSNTGVMRRRVDLRWRIQQGGISRLQRTQLDLLQQAAPRLKPGGVLVYSTCSLEPEENQHVVRQFLQRHKDFTLEWERELLPFTDKVDGAFVARLKRLP